MKDLLQGAFLATVVLTGLNGCMLAVGAGVTGGAYEYQNKEALERLEEKYEAGEISKEEYLRRKREIEEGSAVY